MRKREEEEIYPFSEKRLFARNTDTHKGIQGRKEHQFPQRKKEKEREIFENIHWVSVVR